MLQISITIILYAFLVALLEARFSTPSAESESIPAETRATKNGREYAPSWAFQRRRLQGHEETFWRIITCLVSSLIRILFNFVNYRCRCPVSYRKSKGQKKLPDPGKLYQKFACFVEELRDAMEIMQKLEQRRGQFPKEMDSMKKIMKVKKECHERLQNEMDIMRKMMEVDKESQNQFQNEMVRIKTIMNEERRRHIF